MNQERNSPKRFSRSEKIFNRRKKAEERQDITLINRTIEINADKRHLEQVGKLLSPENLKLLVMNDMEKALYRAGLEIEQNWLQLKCGVITREQQKQLLSEYMDKLFTAMPDVHNALVHVKLDEPSMAQQIHNRVFPPKPAGIL